MHWQDDDNLVLKRVLKSFMSLEVIINKISHDDIVNDSMGMLEDIMLSRSNQRSRTN